jgi:Holliday junction resolvasome RuvABC endonuclease subunit
VGIYDSLTKPKASKVIGVDISTKSLAFAIFIDGKPDKCGEIFFNGSDVFERLKDCKMKIARLVDTHMLDADFIVIESAIMVRNVGTAIDLAYVFGAALGELGRATPELHKAAPITWQTGIGNPNLKKHEKEAIQAEFPGKSKTWYSNRGREIRKARTLEIAREHFAIETDSDNVGDAVGLALYATKTLTRHA